MDIVGNLGLPRLTNFQLISEIATLGFITGSEAGKDALEVISAFKIGSEIYQRLNQDDAKLAALRAKTILKISEYVQKNPRASNDQMAKEIEKEIKIFANEANAIIN